MSYSSVKTFVPGAIVLLITGPMVFCWTSAGIRMTIRPPRWIMDHPEDRRLLFSLASVPRPGAPFT
jgi:hypothetical protein